MVSVADPWLGTSEEDLKAGGLFQENRWKHRRRIVTRLCRGTKKNFDSALARIRGKIEGAPVDQEGSRSQDPR